MITFHRDKRCRKRTESRQGGRFELRHRGQSRDFFSGHSFTAVETDERVAIRTEVMTGALNWHLLFDTTEKQRQVECQVTTLSWYFLRRPHINTTTCFQGFLIRTSCSICQGHILQGDTSTMRAVVRENKADIRGNHIVEFRMLQDA